MTSYNSAQEVGRRLLELELVTPNQWAEAAAEVGDGSADDAIQYLERKSILTALQISKFSKGDEVGYFLGPFKVLYKISAGTFARVYRGVDADTGDVVAIKVLRGRHTMDPESVKQFHREARLTESLSHPNIVKTLEVGTDNQTNQHFIGMEFVEGGNLRELLRSRGKIEPAEVVRLAVEMVEGLAYALSRGVTHRDIKPTNVLFTTGGQIKWVDFGLAGLTEAKSMIPQKLEEQQQRPVDYAGLEKATGAPKGDPRTDIFFLGAVLYLMATGEPAMPETKDRNARMMASRFTSIRPLHQNPHVPRVLADVIDRMLSYRPEARYQNYETLLRDLKAAGPQLSKLAADPEAAAVEAAMVGFPPGPPRLMVVHSKVKLHDELKDKLEKRGFPTVCTTDLGRAAMLHDIKPFHCVVLDLGTTGKEGVNQYIKLKRKAADANRNLAGIFLASTPEHSAWTKDLETDRTVTLTEQPMTLAVLHRALAALLPGVALMKNTEVGQAAPA